MIVQPSVLIVTVSHAVRCAAGARQKGRGRSAVQVVNNIIAGMTKVACDARPRRVAVTRNRNKAIDQRRSIQDRRNPIFQQNIDPRVRQESSQRHQ